MMDLVAPPDVESAAYALLQAALPDAHVGTRYPSGANEPAEVVRLSTTGGDVTNLVLASARLLVECWADDEADAWRLAATAHAHLCEAGGEYAGVTIYRATADLPVNYPDVNRANRFRFQFLATIYARMEALS